MTLPRIGILGGMGPEATILMQSRILAASLKSGHVHDDADHIPLLVDMNNQVPSRIDFLIHGRGADPEPVLVDMATKLESMGADALVMPCNTAHHFAPAIEAATKIPFFNMPALACEKAVKSGAEWGAKIGILASPATDKTDLFKTVLEQHNAEAVFPDDQDAMLAAIQAIKVSGLGNKSLETLNLAADELVSKGVGALVVGCSEFSLATHKLISSKPIIDTMDVVVDKVVDFAYRAIDQSRSSLKHAFSV